MSNHRRFLLLATCIVGTLLSGCAKEEITEYTVDKPKPPYRLLAAMVPQLEKTWFIRMQGPRTDIEQNKAAFDTFVASLQFDANADNPIQWKLPDGWVESDKKTVGGFRRYATLKVGPEAESTEVVVTSLEGAGGSILPNVNRYRRQLGRPPLKQHQLPYAVKKQMLGDIEITRVDIKGKRPAAPSALPSHGGGPMSQ